MSVENWRSQICSAREMVKNCWPNQTGDLDAKTYSNYVDENDQQTSHAFTSTAFIIEENSKKDGQNRLDASMILLTEQNQNCFKLGSVFLVLNLKSKEAIHVMISYIQFDLKFCNKLNVFFNMRLCHPTRESPPSHCI